MLHTQTKTLPMLPFISSWTKILSVFIYTFCLKWLSLAFITFNSKNILFGFFILMIFLPEIGLIFSKNFRTWLKAGIEDNDGQFNSSDLSNLLRHYATLWCARLYVIFGILEAFYHIQVREIFVMGSLAGAFGIEAVGLFTRKK